MKSWHLKMAPRLRQMCIVGKISGSMPSNLQLYSAVVRWPFKTTVVMNMKTIFHTFTLPVGI